ncbi:hypothetical protein EVAR_15734_1 [Eumeta japonica]|uniref:Uncharacterized protein n=1 Tax=Eumeta variegata TaxID=151549 RepID=A0A4C1U9R1_EUMVA|nr:hypothetical protein EVAR_15734_1 [Eumeta japonica]
MAPTKADKKAEVIVVRFRENGENATENLLKIKLLEVMQQKKRPARCIVDETASEYGFSIVRIPPATVNIELIWIQQDLSRKRKEMADDRRVKYLLPLPPILAISISRHTVRLVYDRKKGGPDSTRHGRLAPLSFERFCFAT